MAEFVGCGLKQVGAFEVLVGPVLRVIKMGVSTIDGEEGMSQGSTLTVKRVAITMSPLFKPGSKSLYEKKTTYSKIVDCQPDLISMWTLPVSFFLNSSSLTSDQT